MSAVMAKRKKRKAPQLSSGQHRRLRVQRIIFTVVALIIVASMVISVVAF